MEYSKINFSDDYELSDLCTLPINKSYNNSGQMLWKAERKGIFMENSTLFEFLAGSPPQLQVPSCFQVLQLLKFLLPTPLMGHQSGPV